MASAVTESYLNENISGRLTAATTVIVVLTTILLALRLYARSLAHVASGWDDILLAPAWLLCLGTCITGYLAIAHGGSGRHVEAVVMEDPDKIVVRGKLLYALSWLSAFSNTFSRTSILVLFRRIFPPGITRTVTDLTIVYLVLFTLAQAIVGLTECRPLAYFWDRSIAGGWCLDQFLFYRMSGILNILGDVVILILPIPTVWTLHASLARRAGIAMVFLSGSCGLIASCVRTSYFFTAAKTSMTDPTWADINLMAWTTVESGLYLSAACMIGLRPLLNQMAGWVMKSRLGVFTTRGTNTRSRRSDRDDGSQLISNMKQDHIRLETFDRDRDTDERSVQWEGRKQPADV
ncbi:uncharacterized protein BO97DRAFT_471836 [Aspergillus homomorphus CBS 101889]|uniref:Rhodopsin domain-containing protein n=1 Tax=Aspergillus homomorphus (strain CBS 101889) TaxID=1450537 RepID=A0A395HQY8_ASPHC|nr:hypothetical protein BO97DRAFT_471836 [Aspergillus homomorphus CBS 101889]RAL10371.1 hypothetical protein BO97DRAFT_471836 [Aspergillus homomorphus CBS 101889]